MCVLGISVIIFWILITQQGTHFISHVIEEETSLVGIRWTTSTQAIALQGFQQSGTSPLFPCECPHYISRTV